VALTVRPAQRGTAQADVRDSTHGRCTTRTGGVGPDGWHDAWRSWGVRRRAIVAEYGRRAVEREARRRWEAIGDGLHTSHRWWCPRCLTTPRPTGDL
jgi:hypothetical protein